jgi:hypothetical protein
VDAAGMSALLCDEYWQFDEPSRILPGHELPKGGVWPRLSARRGRRCWAEALYSIPDTDQLSEENKR